MMLAMTAEKILLLMKNYRRAFSALCAGLAAAALLSAAAAHSPDVRRTVFTAPAASAASLFLGAARTDDGEDIILAASAGLLRVTPECSGVSFWAMLTGLLLFAALRRPLSKKSLSLTAAALPCVWLYAITVNGMRIAASYQVAAFFPEKLVSRYGAGAHLWTGIIFFIPALIVLNIFLERSSMYGKLQK
jgi:exosortase/archaeosortase family protein